MLEPTNIITIFVSLLIERRIIFCASKLSTLSACVQAAVALLYPFNWQVCRTRARANGSRTHAHYFLNT